MKLITLLFFASLTFRITQSQAKTVFANSHPCDKARLLDTLRDEFNLKKKSTERLINGKSPGAMLAFYEYYLQEKDLSRADSLVDDLLKSTSDVDVKHKISLVSYKYTSDTKTLQLFLSDITKINEYRAYLLKFKVASLQSNGDKWAHYYDLVALDSAFYKIAPDSLVKKKLGAHYNSLAWYSILTQKLNNVEYYLNQSINYDPQSKYPYANRPLLLLLKGQYKEAQALYIKLKDQPFDMPNFTFKDEFLEDFKELAAVGITNADIKKITRLLNSTSKK